jgi:hypothetical protein
MEDDGRLEDDPNMSSIKELPPEEVSKRESSAVRRAGYL